MNRRGDGPHGDTTPSRRRPHPRRLLALHEAAHACVGISRGEDIMFVTIRPGTDGGSEFEGYCKPTPRTRWIEDVIDVNLAGYLAERHAADPGCDLIDFYEDLGGAPDLAKSVELALGWPGIDSDTAAYFYILDRSRRVEMDLVHLWPAIEAVADALLRKRRLDGDQVAAIYRARAA